MERSLPAGTVTFLFTDVEGSTKLLHELGAGAYAEALAEHRRIVRETCARHGGAEVDTQGDAFFVAFTTAPGALAAARELCEELAPGQIRVRIGVHTGTPLLTDEGYVGADVHRAARIAACGHGGQVLVSSATAALVGDGLRDLGAHRLKDLSAPERIYQLGDGEFPPLKSLHQTNLPVLTTPFLGREKELGEVLGLLSRDDVRLLTLTGPGGTGKTRLGAQAAGALAERYPHGVWWIPLAPLRDAALVTETAAQTLGAQDGLADHIGEKSMLLLFDNFEHLVDAAGDVATLLESCPKLEVLVTSREPLHVSGEQEYAVSPFVHEEGVGFFLARARAVDPRFEPDDAVSEICRRLDDLPLALELAAARVKALTTQQILERLERRLPLLTGGARNLPERQRTLRATIAWSYDLLAPEEQRLFARLAAFRGGCTLEAAERVANADLDMLQSLVDKSLVRHAEDRYSMLETIREYATQRLEDSGAAADVRTRHAEHFLAIAEGAEPHLLEHGAAADLLSGKKDWVESLDRELDNIRAALDWFEAQREGQMAQRLAGALGEYWCGANRVPEGGRRIEQALGLDDTETPARAKALVAAAHMARDAGDPSKARMRAEAALALHRRFGDDWATGHALLWLGEAVADEGDFPRALRLFEECAQTFAAVEDRYFELMARRLEAWMHRELGDKERARALHEENLGRAQAHGYVRVEATTLGALASYAVEDRRVADARRLAREALRLYRGIGSPRGVTTELCRCAAALAVSGRPQLAAQLLSCSEAIHEETGMGILPYLAEENALTVALIREQLDEDAFAKACEIGRTLSADAAVALAMEALED